MVSRKELKEAVAFFEERVGYKYAELKDVDFSVVVTFNKEKPGTPKPPANSSQTLAQDDIAVPPKPSRSPPVNPTVSTPSKDDTVVPDNSVCTSRARSLDVPKRAGTPSVDIEGPVKKAKNKPYPPIEPSVRDHCKYEGYGECDRSSCQAWHEDQVKYVDSIEYDKSCKNWTPRHKLPWAKGTQKEGQKRETKHTKMAKSFDKFLKGKGHKSGNTGGMGARKGA